ncbi:MAG: 50S ribosomal protein L28 [Candidatus Omnitrophica bacterium]|nr:50S ribosomal protein L28 [Candidatus Omnitrophota bacterium]
MKKVCSVCGKGTMRGNKIVRRGMAKKKGGAGQKITGITKRVFLPNLQLINIISNNRRKKACVCVKCIKAGKITKA